MSPERWQRLASLLDDVLELDARARGPFLDAACAGDTALRAEIDALVAADEEAGGFLDDSAADFAATLLEDLERAAGERLTDEAERREPVGPYRIVRALGQGGMGTVYLAERADGQFEQQVALKLIRPGMDRREILRRFLQERQILARLQHPNIARLLDGGVTDDGQPYFAMEYVEGEPITAYCDAHRCSVEDRLRLFLDVAEAVAFAHRNLVVHRDLKPSNILITEDHRAEAHVKLLDFGIAKLLHKDDAEETLIETQMGLRVMTPEYAAPEQARGDAVTTATDIYALGVVLYELLSGHRPYAFTLRSAMEMERVICGTEPPRPSAIAAREEAVRRSNGTTETIRPEAVAAARGTTPERLRRHLAGDLDTIILKALRKEPALRYASAEALVDDLRRHLDGQAVEAHRGSVGYRARKFVRRHRVGVAAAVGAVVLLLVGVAGTLWQARLVSREAARTEAALEFTLGLFDVANPALGRADTLTVREMLDLGTARLDELAGQPAVLAEVTARWGDIYLGLGDFEPAQQLLAWSADLRRAVYGDGHEEVAVALHLLGRVALDRSDFDQAERLGREAVALRQQTLGERHPETAASLGLLAQILHRKGDYAESEQLFGQALGLSRSAYGDEHEQVAAVLNDFALLRRTQGRLDEAEALAREALAIRHAVLGDEHLDTATSTNNLAVILRKRDRLDEAEALYRQVLAFDRKRLGTGHPNLATVTSNLAGVLRERGRYAEADSLYRWVLASDLASFGPESRYVAMSTHHLAGVLSLRGDYDEAERLEREALGVYLRLHGEGHPHVAASTAALADVLSAQGETAAATALYDQAVAVLRAAPDAELDLAEALLGQGRLLDAQGAAHEAEPLLRESLRLREAAFGDDHTDTAEARVALGVCLHHLGQTEAARQLLDAGYATLRARRGDAHRLTRQALTALAELDVAYLGSGR